MGKKNEGKEEKKDPKEEIKTDLPEQGKNFAELYNLFLHEGLEDEYVAFFVK